MILALLQFACTTPCESSYTHGETEAMTFAGHVWNKTAITDGICGSAFITSADLNDDGSKEILISNFGKPDGFGLTDGFITSYSYDQGVQSYSQPVSAEDYYKWPNEIETHDMDQDGDLDLLVGFGFLTCQLNPWNSACGALSWIENDAGEWTIHDIVERGSDLFYHKALMLDVNDDGIDDVLATGENYATPFGSIDQATFQVWIAEEAGVYAQEPIDISEGLGSIPQLHDVDLDGDLDVVSGEYFAANAQSFVWLEFVSSATESSPGGEWKRHIIDDSVGPSIQISVVENLLGDGVARAIGSNHTNTEKSTPDEWASGVYLYTPTSDPTALWERETVYDEFISDSASTQAAPGVFSVGDIDDDGDLDMLVSGDGDPRVFWMEQEEGSFITHVLLEDMPQAGVHVTDLDGDGQTEILFGSYDKNVVFLFTKEEAAQ